MHQASPHLSSPPKRSSVFDHPIGFWFFFWGEFAERCCYYGMQAILLLYMIQILRFDDSQASRVLNYFLAACYLLPLVGGYVADNFLGKYRTIVYFAVPYIFGQVLLSITSLQNETCLYFSLALLAMGSGVIKPNISTLMGMTYDQYRPGRTKLRSDAFAMFYGSINIGAALSAFFVPAIRNYFGGDSRAYAMAFLFPAGLMVLSFIVFALGKPFYAKEIISRERLTPEDRHKRWVVLRRLLGLFLVVMIFWSMLFQAGSTWLLLARDYLRLDLFGWIKITPDQLQAVNPILIIVLLPPVTMMWHLLDRFGLSLKPTSKMLIGFVLTTITMLTIALAAFQGTAAVAAGASMALADGEKAMAALTASSDGNSVRDAAQKLIVAAAAQRAAKDGGEPAKAAALSFLQQAQKTAQEAGAGPVAAATARNTASAALLAARAALHASENTAPDAATLEQIEASVASAFASAEATGEAIRLAAEAARDGNHAEKPYLAIDLASCVAADTRASAAAAAANRTLKAVKAGNAEAAKKHASLAAVHAADATVAAGLAVASLQGNPIPDEVQQAEQAVSAARISLLWQLIPYLVITIGEICISVVGLELAFAAAPAAMKSFVTACWLLTISLGSLLNAQVTPFYNEMIGRFSLTPDWYFFLFAVLMVPVTLAFMLVARRFNRLTA